MFHPNKRQIMTYNWGVWVNNKIIGYVRSQSEFDAIKLAKEKLAKNNQFFIERTYLGNPIPVEKDFCYSKSNKEA